MQQLALFEKTIAAFKAQKVAFSNHVVALAQLYPTLFKTNGLFTQQRDALTQQIAALKRRLDALTHQNGAYLRLVLNESLFIRGFFWK